MNNDSPCCRRRVDGWCLGERSESRGVGPRRGGGDGEGVRGGNRERSWDRRSLVLKVISRQIQEDGGTRRRKRTEISEGST